MAGQRARLANVMERLTLLVDRSEVRASDLELVLGGDRAAAPASPSSPAGEREQILAALEATGWNIMRTAARLGVSRNTVRARMDRWGLRPAGRRGWARRRRPAAARPRSRPSPRSRDPRHPRSRPCGGSDGT